MIIALSVDNWYTSRKELASGEIVIEFYGDNGHVLGKLEHVGGGKSPTLYTWKIVPLTDKDKEELRSVKPL